MSANVVDALLVALLVLFAVAFLFAPTPSSDGCSEPILTSTTATVTCTVDGQSATHTAPIGGAE